MLLLLLFLIDDVDCTPENFLLMLVSIKEKRNEMIRLKGVPRFNTTHNKIIYEDHCYTLQSRTYTCNIRSSIQQPGTFYLINFSKNVQGRFTLRPRTFG